MGRNEEELRRSEQKYLKSFEEISNLMTVSDAAKVMTSSNLGNISLMLSRIADTLEELNENIKSLVADRNTNPAHTDDGK